MTRSKQLLAVLVVAFLPAACSHVEAKTSRAEVQALARSAASPADRGAEQGEPSGALGPSEAREAPAKLEVGIEASAGPGRRVRASAPLGVLSQMVTTQALLVSLLLAPVSSAAAPPAAGPAGPS